MSAPRALVVGAGLAGLATARALVDAGFTPDVVERQPAWTHAGAGIYLPGNAVRALGALGLAPAVVDQAVPIPLQRVCDPRGRVLFEVDVAELWAGVGPCVALHRAALHAVLLDGAGGAAIRCGTTLRACEQDGAAVSVVLSDGARRDYDLLVGADGIHSTVRRLAFGNRAAARPLGRAAWRFVTQRPAAVTTWSALLGRSSTLLTLPIGEEQAYCYLDAASSGQPDRRPVATLDRVRTLLAEFGDPAPAILASLADAPPVHASVIEEVTPGDTVSGRVVLVGDAAHATSPNMAQGAAMAFEDAVVLAGCLRRSATVPDALAAFQARRRRRTEWVRRQTHRRDRTRSLPPALRDVLLRAGGRRMHRAHHRPLRDRQMDPGTLTPLTRV